MENKIAKIIKNYAFINAIASVILAVILSSSIGVFFVVAITGIVSSIFIYALGEIIDLLQAIKNNTSNGGLDSTLPPL